jgi:Flp pilus assembly protein TadG
MKQKISLNPLQLIKRDDGVTAVLAAMWMFTLISLSGVSVEAGHAYYAYQQLVASTNAATLAAAAAMPDTRRQPRMLPPTVPSQVKRTPALS